MFWWLNQTFFTSPWGDSTWKLGTFPHGLVANGDENTPSQILWPHPLEGEVDKVAMGSIEGGGGVYVTGALDLTTPEGGLVTIVP